MSFRIYRGYVNPVETDTKGRLFVVDVSITWTSNRNRRTKELDSWKATQPNLLRQKSVIIMMMDDYIIVIIIFVITTIITIIISSNIIIITIISIIIIVIIIRSSSILSTTTIITIISIIFVIIIVVVVISLYKRNQRLSLAEVWKLVFVSKFLSSSSSFSSTFLCFLTFFFLFSRWLLSSVSIFIKPQGAGIAQSAECWTRCPAWCSVAGSILR